MKDESGGRLLWYSVRWIDRLERVRVLWLQENWFDELFPWWTASELTYIRYFIFSVYTEIEEGSAGAGFSRTAWSWRMPSDNDRISADTGNIAGNGEYRNVSLWQTETDLSLLYSTGNEGTVMCRQYRWRFIRWPGSIYGDNIAHLRSSGCSRWSTVLSVKYGTEDYGLAGVSIRR